MSEHDEGGLDELERRLDAAFATTRPRRDFEDELWERLRRRGARRSGRWLDLGLAAAAGSAVLLVVGIAGLALSHAHFGGASTASSGTPTIAAAPTVPRAQSGAAALARLPAPAAAGVVQVVGGGTSPLPSGSAGIALSPAIPLPVVPARLVVYTFRPGSGPASGAIVEAATARRGPVGPDYPSVQPGEAVAGVSAGASAPNPAAPAGIVQLSAVRLVYVSVVSAGQGYLEPAYLFTGTLQAGGHASPVQVLLPALADSAFQ